MNSQVHFHEMTSVKKIPNLDASRNSLSRSEKNFLTRQEIFGLRSEMKFNLQFISILCSPKQMNKQVDTNQPHVVELLEQINEYQNANANQDPDPDQKPKRKYNKKPKQSNTRAKASPITPATCIDPKKKQRVIIEQSDMRSEWMKENTSKDLPKVV